jgi:hypothetical protein
MLPASFVIKMKPYHIFLLSVEQQNMSGALWLWLLGHLTGLKVSLNSFGGFLALYLLAETCKLLGWLQSVGLFGNC